MHPILEITEIKMVLADPPPTRDGILAYSDLVLNGQLVIKGVRLTRTGSRFRVGMPNREKVRDCPRCRIRCFLSHRVCHQCGSPLPHVREPRPYIDIVHPNNQSLREHMENILIEEYTRQLDQLPPPT
jgi:DNA-binding cell septation regulator SpoVG